MMKYELEEELGKRSWLEAMQPVPSNPAAGRGASLPSLRGVPAACTAHAAGSQHGRAPPILRAASTVVPECAE